MAKNHTRRRYICAFLGLLLLVALDQWSKFLAIRYLKDQEDLAFLPGIVKLHYLENRGAAFGILQNQQWVFLLLGLCFLAIACYVFRRLPYDRHYRPLAILVVVISAGAIGNMIDRLVRHFVVDFFCTTFIDFPIFNVADIYVTLGVIFLIICVLFVYQEQDFEFLSGKSEKTYGKD